MQKYMRWSGMLVVLMLILAACQSNGGSSSEPSTDASTPPASQGGGGTADCDADEFGCIELAEGDPIVIGTALVITGANESLGLDSQYGAQVANSLRPEIAGHEVEFNFQDDGCSTEGGTAAARALVSEENIAGVIGTSCSSAGIPAAEILSAEGIMLVSPSNTAPSLTAPDTHEAFYARTAHNDSIQGAAMAEFVCDVLGLSSAATIDDGSAYADQLAAVFAAEFPSQCDGTITAEEAITVGQTDFTGVLENIAADSPEFLYYPIFVAEGALITQQAPRPRASRTPHWAVLMASSLPTGWPLPAVPPKARTCPVRTWHSAATSTPMSSCRPTRRSPAKMRRSACSMHTRSTPTTSSPTRSKRLPSPMEAPPTSRAAHCVMPSSPPRAIEGITGTLTCDENGDCADAKISVSQVVDGAFERIWPES